MLVAPREIPSDCIVCWNYISYSFTMSFLTLPVYPVRTAQTQPALLQSSQMHPVSKPELSVVLKLFQSRPPLEEEQFPRPETVEHTFLHCRDDIALLYSFGEAASKTSCYVITFLKETDLSKRIFFFFLPSHSILNPVWVGGGNAP